MSGVAEKIQQLLSEVEYPKTSLARLQKWQWVQKQILKMVGEAEKQLEAYKENRASWKRKCWVFEGQIADLQKKLADCGYEFGGANFQKEELEGRLKAIQQFVEKRLKKLEKETEQFRHGVETDIARHPLIRDFGLVRIEELKGVQKELEGLAKQ